jgi:RimJ/RimL family protein N-acetyltransferase
MDLQIRVLTEKDAGELFRLRCQSLLAAPEVFLASPGDDLVSSEDAARELLMRGGDAAVFGAFADGLQGMLGLYRATHLKSAHKIHLWGMFVLPQWRRRGVGGALLHAAIAHARTLPGVSSVHLGVSGAAPAARRLYERAGFTVWGVEREAIRLDGRSFDEHHMVMRVSAD